MRFDRVSEEEEFDGKKILVDFFGRHLQSSTLSRQVFFFYAARRARRRKSVVSFFDDFFRELTGWPVPSSRYRLPNNSMQRTALPAAADAERVDSPNDAMRTTARPESDRRRRDAHDDKHERVTE